MIREVVEVVEKKLQGMGFAYIDVDRGQADGEMPSVKMPAALVQITGVERQSGFAGKSFMQQLTMRVRVLQVVLGNSSMAAPADQREAWFDFAALVEQVWQELHYNCPELPIEYRGIYFVKRDDGVSECEIEFIVSLGTMSGEKAEKKITIEIEKDGKE